MKIRKFIASLMITLLPLLSFSQTLFQKYIQGQDNWSYGYNDNDEVLLIGDDGFFVNFTKLDDDATILWSKKFTTFDDIVHAIVIPSTNKRLYHLSGDSANIYLSATNNFNYLGAKLYPYDTSIFNPYNSSLICGKRFANGNIALVGKTEIPTGGGMGSDLAPMVALTDSIGNLLWSRQYRINGHSLSPFKIVENNNGYLLAGAFFTYSGGLQTITSLATLLIDKQTGAPIGDVHEAHFDGEINMFNISDDGKYIVGNSFDVFATGHTFGMVAKIRDDGSFQFITNINTNAFGNPSMILRTVTVMNGTSITVAGSMQNYFFACKADSALNNIHWGMMYSDTSASGDLLNQGEAYLSKTTTDNNLLYWGAFTYASGMGYAIKANAANGMSACNNIPLKLSFNTIPYLFSTYTMTSTPNVLGAGQSITLTNPTPEPSSGAVSTMCSATIGVEEMHPETSITLFPNPAHQQVELYIPKALLTEDTKFILVNSLGQSVNQFFIHNETTKLELNEMVSGIYFYYCQNKDSILKKGKLIIE